MSLQAQLGLHVSNYLKQTVFEKTRTVTRTIVGTMLWTEYTRRPVIKIGPKGALGSHEIRPIHSAPSLGQSRVWSGKRYAMVCIFVSYVSTITYEKNNFSGVSGWTLNIQADINGYLSAGALTQRLFGRKCCTLQRNQP